MTGSARCSQGKALTSRWPRERTGRWRGDARKTEGEQHHVVEESPGAADDVGQYDGDGHDQDAEQHEVGAPLALLVVRGEECERGWGQAVNFMADTMPRTIPEAKGCLRCASTMASKRKATTGMSSPPVASGSAAMGRMAMTCRARILWRLLARHRARASPATPSVAKLKKIRVAECVVVTALAGDAEGVHDGQIGIERVDDRLVRGAVADMALGVGDRVVRILALGQGLATSLNDTHLGLLVVPVDLERQRDGGGAGKHKDGQPDAQAPRAAGGVVIEPGASPAEEGEDDGGTGAEEIRPDGQPRPTGGRGGRPNRRWWSAGTTRPGRRG